MWKKPRDVLLRHNSQSKRDRGSHTPSAISFEVALLCQVQMSFFRNLVIIYLISTYFLSPRLCSKGSSACRGQFRDSCFFLYKSHIPLDFPLCENVVTLLPSASVLTLSVTHKSHLRASVHSDYLKGILRGWSGGGGGAFPKRFANIHRRPLAKDFFFFLERIQFLLHLLMAPSEVLGTGRFAAWDVYARADECLQEPCSQSRLPRSALALGRHLAANHVALIQSQTGTEANQNPNSFPERK